jgi:hypothetical protein
MNRNAGRCNHLDKDEVSKYLADLRCHLETLDDGYVNRTPWQKLLASMRRLGYENADLTDQLHRQCRA